MVVPINCYTCALDMMDTFLLILERREGEKGRVGYMNEALQRYLGIEKGGEKEKVDIRENMINQHDGYVIGGSIILQDTQGNEITFDVTGERDAFGPWDVCTLTPNARKTAANNHALPLPVMMGIVELQDNGVKFIDTSTEQSQLPYVYGNDFTDQLIDLFKDTEEKLGPVSRDIICKAKDKDTMAVSLCVQLSHLSQQVCVCGGGCDAAKRDATTNEQHVADPREICER